jgi:hypothetical protein
MARVHDIRSSSRHLAGALGLVLAGVGQAWAQACAMCGSALTNDPLGRAFSWSVLFLMAAPYALVATVGGWLFLTYRRAGARRQAAVIDLSRGRRPAEVAEGDPS